MAEVQVVSRVLHPRRPREVIDVDALEEEESFHLDYGRAVRRRLSSSRQTTRVERSPSSGSIIILDSDEEEAGSSSSAPSQSTGHRHHFMSPPPRHLAENGSFPAHLRSAPVIRPNDQPFPFEANINAASRAPSAPRPAPAAAPPSHHQPSMGLGGGFIALNRRMAQVEEERLRELPPRGRSWTDLFRRRYVTEHLPPMPWEDEFVYGAILEQHWFVDPPPRWDFAATAGRSSPHHWEPAYTHPIKPTSGFTFDFAPAEGSSAGSSSSRTVIVLDDEDAGPSSSSASSTYVETEAMSTLVCARCLDPLILSAGGAGLTEGELTKKRVWALRCGHMLDGKCVEDLMRPSPPSPMPVTLDLPEEESNAPGKLQDDHEADIAMPGSFPSIGKDKGKARAQEAPTQDRKGKGRAIAPPEPEMQTVPTSAAFPQQEDNPMRSRLRTSTRRRVTASSRAAPLPSRQHQPTEPVHSAPIRRPMAALPRARGKGKGKARVQKPVIEANFAWDCPVFGCGYAHESVCIAGEWKMHDERGAIALFV